MMGRRKILVGVLLVLLGVLTALGFSFGRVQRSLLPWAEAWFPEGMFRVAVVEPLVVLTIDDGLSDRTIEILDLLDRYDAKATFFIHTRSLTDLPQGPALLQTLIDRGHEVGHHMPEDIPSVSLSPADFATGFRESNRAFQSLGLQPRYFRAAGGRYQAKTMMPLLIEGQYHPQFVMASFLPWDTHLPWPRWYADQLIQGIFPGAIVVFHDGLQKGEGRLQRTLIGLERFLAAMAHQRYRVVSLDMGRSG